MKKKILSHLLCSALVILCSALMPMLLFFQNIGAVKFYEIAIFIGIYSFIGLFVFAIFKFIMKSEYKAGIAAAFFSLIFQNSGRLTALISYKFVLVIFFAVIIAAVILIKKFLKNEIAKTFVPVLSVVLVILLAMNTVLSIGKIISVANTNSEIETDINKQYEYIQSYKDTSATVDELPNIYLIIPDEYAGFNTLEKFYGYDNADFKAFLEDHKFNISTSSTSYRDGTLESLANLFNLEYSENNNYSKTSEAYCQKKLENGCLFRLAEDSGYTINVAQSIPLVKYSSTTETYGDKWSSTGDSKSTIDVMTAPSLLAPFTDKIRSVLNGVPMDYFVGKGHIVNQANSFADPLIYFADSQNVVKENSFNLCYAMIPHQPFYFDEEGNIYESTEHLNDWADKQYYLNQLKYCTTLLESAIDNIIKNDPDSIIILMSDHGARNHSEESPANEWMNEMSATDNTEILCAVYYKGKNLDINSMFSSNVLISVVNKAWGYNIPLITQSDDMYYKAP